MTNYLEAFPFGSRPPFWINVSYPDNCSSEPLQKSNARNITLSYLTSTFSYLVQKVILKHGTYLCSGASSPSNLILNLIPIEWLLLIDSIYWSNATMNSEGLVLSESTIECMDKWASKITWKKNMRLHWNVMRFHKLRIPWLIINSKHSPSVVSMPCCCKDTQVHTMAWYNWRWHICLLPHCTSHSNTKFTILPSIIQTIT